MIWYFIMIRILAGIMWGQVTASLELLRKWGVTVKVRLLEGILPCSCFLFLSAFFFFNFQKHGDYPIKNGLGEERKKKKTLMKRWAFWTGGVISNC